MNYTGIQERLDATGEVTLPVGDYAPALPLFLDSGMVVRGYDAGSRLDAYSCGTPFMVGVPRGLIDSSHYPGGAYRTKGDSHLWAGGDHWSLGPVTGGWPSVTTTIVIHLSATLNSGDWSSLSAGILGMQANTGVPDPRPWCMYAAAGGLYLALRTTDGVIHTFHVDSPAGDNLDVTWTVHLDSGAVACQVNSTPASVTGSPLPPASRLAANYTFGFSLGRLSPFPAAEGYFGGDWPDLTISACEVTADGLQVGRLWPGSRPGPLSGKTLPLVPASGYWGGRWVLAVSRGQGTQSAQDVRIENVRVQAASSCPAIQHGGIQGGLLIRDCQIEGGSRAVSSLGLGVAYPITIEGGRFEGQTDCHVFAYRSGYFRMVGTQLAYAGRTPWQLLGCSGVIQDVMIAPGGPVIGQSVDIYGTGTMPLVLERVQGDYEGSPGSGYVFCRVQPMTWDQPWFPTLVDLRDCSAGASPTGERWPLVDASAEPPVGYTGAIRVTADSLVIRAQPGGSE